MKVRQNKKASFCIYRFACLCVNGFEGPLCETNADDCAGRPCLYGALCTDRVASFHCVCPPGRTGLYCHLPDACASNPCRAGAVCATSVFNGSYACACPQGYAGVDCDADLDECREGETESDRYIKQSPDVPVFSQQGHLANTAERASTPRALTAATVPRGLSGGGARRTSTSAKNVPARTREPASTSEAVFGASACQVGKRLQYPTSLRS